MCKILSWPLKDIEICMTLHDGWYNLQSPSEKHFQLESSMCRTCNILHCNNFLRELGANPYTSLARTYLSAMLVSLDSLPFPTPHLSTRSVQKKVQLLLI